MSWGVMAISVPPRRFSSNRNPISSGSMNSPRIGKCIGDSGGNNESKTVLDAFLLGKALGEVVNGRIESGVGEFLSMIGRLQAEQQDHLFELQEQVLEKAKRAKEQAASRDVIEAQGPTAVSSGVPHSTSSHKDPPPFYLIGLLND